MKISPQTAREVAQLARLGLSEEELATVTGQLESILSYMHELEELDTTGVEATTHVVPLPCPTRPDQVVPSRPREIIVGQAPTGDAEFFVVPRIIE